MATSDNRKAFDAGMKKAEQIIYGHIYGILCDVCDAAVVYAMNNHSGFNNFTGNTHTGYVCGLFMDGALQYYAASASLDKPPVRVKLTAGETAYLDPDYDGNTRSFRGVIETDQGYAFDYAMKFLNGYSSKVKKGFQLVMTTGTEYSEYLENVRHADVLTGTFEEIPQILFKNLKPIR